jgi:hypothetical protein
MAIQKYFEKSLNCFPKKYNLNIKMSIKPDRIEQINNALGFAKGEDVDVCQMFGTNPVELNNVINLEKFPNFLNEKIFGEMNTNIKLLNVRPNGNFIFLIEPPSSSPLYKHLFIYKFIIEGNYNPTPTPNNIALIENLNDDILAEHVISKIMLNLVKYKVTPHVLGGIFTSPLINLDSIYKKLEAYFAELILTHQEREKILDILKSLSTKSSISGMLQESFMIKSDEYAIKSFSDIIKDNIDFENPTFYYILFQIIYTLAVFRKINLKHQDLHTENIIVLLEKPDPIPKYTKYTIGKTSYYLKDIGISSAIIDFGLSVKHPSLAENTVALEHVNTKLNTSLGSHHITQSKTAKVKHCFHRDFNIFNMLKYLNAGSPNNDAMQYDDLYKLLNHLYSDYTFKQNDTLDLVRSNFAKQIIKSIFFKADGAGVVDFDSFFSEKDTAFSHFNSSKFKKFNSFTNDYNTILQNICAHVNTKFEDSKDCKDCIVSHLDAKKSQIVESYDIDNLTIKKSDIKPAIKTTHLAKEPLKTLINELNLVPVLEPYAISGGKRSKSVKKNNRKYKTKKYNRK